MIAATSPGTGGADKGTFQGDSRSESQDKTAEPRASTGRLAAGATANHRKHREMLAHMDEEAASAGVCRSPISGTGLVILPRTLVH